ncbi:MAG TPA: long-chain fatty acid--CoA ligase [Terriglobia bacterium]|nr:long-chain fatty acid--CoA ligase [Terriglobia bacterium]
MPSSQSNPLASFNTLPELFLRAIEKHPKPDAFLYKSGGGYRGMSSDEALRKVAALARAFDRLGIRRGDRVAILAENRLEWALTDYAVLGLGAVVVPIYPTLLSPDVEFILRDSAAKGVVVSTDLQLQKIMNIRAALPDLSFMVVMDCTSLAPSEAQCWATLAPIASGLAEPGDSESVEFFRARSLEVQPQATATILYTSGTTGDSKGVVLTHSNIVSNIVASEGLFPLGQHDVAISFLPLSHIFERMLDYDYFWQGVSIAYAESFEALPQNLLEARPTIMAVVPRVLEKTHDKVMEAVRSSPAPRRKLFAWAVRVGEAYFPYRLERRSPPLGLRLRHAVADRLVFRKIRVRLGGRITVMISGAAPLSPDLCRFFFACGLPVYEGYGLTETSPVIAVNYPGCVKLGTVGRVVPGVEVKLSDEQLDPEGEGAGREILVRGPNVTPGYYHLEEANREAFADGWFRTGDLGRIDSDGFLAITGRKKHLFKTSGGKYVAPEKLENLFQGHPYVSQILVLGDGRKFVGALVVPNFPRLESYARSQGIGFQGHEELVGDPRIAAFVERQVDEACQGLAAHERIRQIVLVPREFSIASGELSPTQKIKRRVVEANFRDEIERMYQRRAQAQGGGK